MEQEQSLSGTWRISGILFRHFLERQHTWGILEEGLYGGTHRLHLALHAILPRSSNRCEGQNHTHKAMARHETGQWIEVELVLVNETYECVG